MGKPGLIVQRANHAPRQDIPTVQALADAVQNGTRAAHEATRRLDTKTMRDELAKVSCAIHSALCYGLSDELNAELRGRGFGGDMLPQAHRVSS